MEYYLGLLPGVIPSHARSRLTLVPVGDASPVVTQLEDPGSTPAAPHDPVTDRRIPPAATSSPTTRQHSSATSQSASASPCTALTPDWPTSAARPDAAGRSRSCGVSAARSAPRTSTPSTTWWQPCKGMRAQTTDAGPGHRQAQRGRLGLRETPWSTCTTCPRPERSRRRPRSRTDSSAMRLEAENLDLDVYLAAFEKDGGIIEERITGDRPHQSERPDARASRRHRRAALHPRSTARRCERSDATSAVCSRRIPTTRSRSVSRRW